MALLNQVSVWWHIGIVAIVVVLIFLTGKPDQSGLDAVRRSSRRIRPAAGTTTSASSTSQYGPATSYPVILAFFFSLLQANWTYTGYDASAHVAEETVGARMASAWGVFLSVAVSAVVGYIFLVALTTHLPNLSTLFPATLETPIQAGASQYYFGGGVAVIDILNYNLGQIGDVLAAGIAIAMWFCGLPSLAAAGRMLFAFSRDDGIPASGWLKRSVAATGRPPTRWSRWPSWPGCSPLRRSSSGPARRSSSSPRSARSSCTPRTASSSTSAPRPTGWIEHRVWSLGRWSKPVAYVGDLLGARPDGPVLLPDLGQHLVAVHGRDRRVLLVVYYFGWARAHFEGPKVMGAEAELTDLEREFEHAAEELGGASPA